MRGKMAKRLRRYYVEVTGKAPEKAQEIPEGFLDPVTMTTTPPGKRLDDFRPFKRMYYDAKREAGGR